VQRARERVRQDQPELIALDTALKNVEIRRVLGVPNHIRKYTRILIRARSSLERLYVFVDNMFLS